MAHPKMGASKKENLSSIICDAQASRYKINKDMITLTWGWQPPQYEKMSNGNIRVFYYSKPYTENVEHENPETG